MATNESSNAGSRVSAEDALHPLKKSRALADAMMALTDSNQTRGEMLQPDTLHWLAVQQADLASEALAIVERSVEDHFSLGKPPIATGEALHG